MHNLPMPYINTRKFYGPTEDVKKLVLRVSSIWWWLNNQNLFNYLHQKRGRSRRPK